MPFAFQKSQLSDYRRSGTDSTYRFLIIGTKFYSRLYNGAFLKVERSGHTAGKNYHLDLICHNNIAVGNIGNNCNSVCACNLTAAYSDGNYLFPNLFKMSIGAIASVSSNPSAKIHISF